MKQIKFALLAFFAVVSFSAIGQNNGYFNDTLTAAVDSIYFYPGEDDILVGAAYETYDIKKRFPHAGTLNVLMVSDSLSGTTSGTAVLQYAFEDQTDGDDKLWYTKTTLAIDGATQQQSLTTDTSFGAISWRVRITGSGTQATRQRCLWSFKPSN